MTKTAITSLSGSGPPKNPTRVTSLHKDGSLFAYTKRGGFTPDKSADKTPARNRDKGCMEKYRTDPPENADRDSGLKTVET